MRNAGGGSAGDGDSDWPHQYPPPLRHTTLTWIERTFGYGVAHAYAGHTDNGGDASTTPTSEPACKKWPAPSPPWSANHTPWPGESDADPVREGGLAGIGRRDRATSVHNWTGRDYRVDAIVPRMVSEAALPT